MIVDRIKNFVEKRVRAHELGIHLVSSESFHVPNKITLNGKRVEVCFPEEEGVKVAFTELLLADCYGLLSVKHPVKTILDIGGNVGIFALAARKAFPDASIHSYEPNPYQEKYLKCQAAAANSEYFMEAVELEDTHVNLNFQSDSVLTTSEVDESGSVPASAFRKTVERLGGHVDFAKVDCEGAEWRFWKDYDAWQKVKFLATEYHIQDGHTHDEARDVVAGLGFTVLLQERYETFGLMRAIRNE